MSDRVFGLQAGCGRVRCEGPPMEISGRSSGCSTNPNMPEGLPTVWDLLGFKTSAASHRSLDGGGEYSLCPTDDASQQLTH